MVWSSLAPKYPILDIFCGMAKKRPIFQYYLVPFLTKAVEASLQGVPSVFDIKYIKTSEAN